MSGSAVTSNHFHRNEKEIGGPGPYRANGIPITCVHCKYDKFAHGYAQLNTAFMTFLNLDFANRSANILTCDRCGYVHWFTEGELLSEIKNTNFVLELFDTDENDGGAGYLRLIRLRKIGKTHGK